MRLHREIWAIMSVERAWSESLSGSQEMRPFDSYPIDHKSPLERNFGRKIWRYGMMLANNGAGGCEHAIAMNKW